MENNNNNSNPTSSTTTSPSSHSGNDATTIAHVRDANPRPDLTNSSELSDAQLNIDNIISEGSPRDPLQEKFYFANFEQLGHDLNSLLNSFNHDVVFGIGSPPMYGTSAPPLVLSHRHPFVSSC